MVIGSIGLAVRSWTCEYWLSISAYFHSWSFCLEYESWDAVVETGFQLPIGVTEEMACVQILAREQGDVSCLI